MYRCGLNMKFAKTEVIQKLCQCPPPPGCALFLNCDTWSSFKLERFPHPDLKIRTGSTGCKKNILWFNDLKRSSILNEYCIADFADCKFWANFLWTHPVSIKADPKFTYIHSFAFLLKTFHCHILLIKIIKTWVLVIGTSICSPLSVILFEIYVDWKEITLFAILLKYWRENTAIHSPYFLYILYSISLILKLLRYKIQFFALIWQISPLLTQTI